MRTRWGGVSTRERGQLVLVTAVALALTFVALGILLNAAAFTGAQAAREDTTDGANPLSFGDTAAEGVNGTIYYVNYFEYGSYERLNTHLEKGVSNWNDATATARAQRRIGTAVRIAETTNGTRIFQDTRANFSNVSDEPTWTVAPDVGETRRFVMNVTKSPLVANSSFPILGNLESLRSSDAFRVNVTNGTGATSGIYFYRESDKIKIRHVEADGALGAICEYPADNITVNLVEGTVDGESCDALVFPGVEGTYDVEFAYGNNTEGKYLLVVDTLYSNVPGQHFSTPYKDLPPYYVRTIFEATVTVTYKTAEVGYTDNVTAAGGPPSVEGPPVFGVDPNVGRELVYVAEGTNHQLHSIAPNGTVTVYNANNVVAIGPMQASLDGDDHLEIPYVTDNGVLKIIDKQNETQTLATTGVAIDKTLLGVGIWNGTGPSVFYVNTSGTNSIYRVRANETPEVALDKDGDDDGISAVAGIADYNNDGDQDIVFVDGTQHVTYYDGGSTHEAVKSVGQSSGVGIGEPRDLDGDTKTRAPAFDGSAKVSLLPYDGNFYNLGPQGIKSPLAAIDWAGGSEMEVLYIEDDSETTLYYVKLDGSKEQVRDADNETVDPLPEPGVA